MPDWPEASVRPRVKDDTHEVYATGRWFFETHEDRSTTYPTDGNIRQKKLKEQGHEPKKKPEGAGS